MPKKWLIALFLLLMASSAVMVAPAAARASDGRVVLASAGTESNARAGTENSAKASTKAGTEDGTPAGEDEGRSAAGTAPGSATGACASKAPIRLAGLDWESGQITTAIIDRLLRDGYGCRTEIVPGSSASLETALMQNDIQLIAEQWVGRSAVMDQAEREHRVAIIGDTLKGGAVQGWYVPDYVQKAYPDLKTVQDLARYARLFPDPEKPGKARLLNCPSGWVCETFNTRLLKNTGLSGAYNNVPPGTGAALDAEISAAFEQHKPILFYYWQPSGLMAKYNMRPIEFPAYDEGCWKTLLKAEDDAAAGQDAATDSTPDVNGTASGTEGRTKDGKTKDGKALDAGAQAGGEKDGKARDGRGGPGCVSGFPVSKLTVAVSMPFRQQHPELVALLEKLQFEPAILNRMILDMAEHRRKGDEQAGIFLRDNPDIWQHWVSDDARVRLQQKYGSAAENPAQPAGFFPSWSVADALNHSLARTVQKHGEQFRRISQLTLDGLLLPLEQALDGLPPWLVLAVLGLVAWHATRRLWMAVLCMAGFYVVGGFGLWTALMQTLALLIASSLFIMLLGFPLGIIMARNERLCRIFTPVLDIIQTMPSFVYLIPVLMLFGIGKVPALFATVVYAIAPLIRLTALGIRQVDARMVEAADSFGNTRWQLLWWVLLPQARPSIMAGINQAVMMSLGMVVVASMIGARGLGEHVLQAIQTLNIGQGVQAGTAIVILAIVIDRITQAYGRKA